jgi:hypothetical protein
MRLIALVPVIALAAALSAPAQAQADTEKVNTVIIYGKDKCPESTDDTITVCATLPESERYRIPEELREHPSPENESWTERALSIQTVGKFGTLSCSATGQGSWTGCNQEFIHKAFAEKKMAPSVRFSELIAAAREARLSKIDAEAADTQKRVEVLEKQYMDRQKAAEAKPDTPASAAPAPVPSPTPSAAPSPN